MFSILIGKILVIIGKIFHKGSSKPGEVALKLNKNFFKKIKLPEVVIAVTGSSGKGSTSSLLARIYRKCGYTVAHNDKGSNLSAGIATLMIENCTLTGKIKKDVLIYEVDERYTKYIFPYITPNYVVISNICRDQPPRQGHFDLVYEEIKKALTTDMHLILNGDDPYLQKFVLDGFNASYFGMKKNNYSYKDNLFKSVNMAYCPKCGGKLEYKYYHFEGLGSYYCNVCDFKRPKIDYQISSLDYNEGTMIINNKYKMHISFNVLYNVYNTVAAFAVAGLGGLDLEKVSNIINEEEANKKLNAYYEYQDRKVSVLSNKNENNTTFNQSILYTRRFEGLKTIVIGWKEISRRYGYNDLSWLYDIDFELLNDENLEKVVCVGIHRFDIATRMKYAGISEKKIECFYDLETATNYLKKETNGDIFAILNFDFVEPFNKLMKTGDKK